MVPDSTNGTSAARHSRLTCFRASRLSRPLRTTWKDRMKSTSKSVSLTLPWCATMRAPGRNLSTVSRATWCGTWGGEEVTGRCGHLFDRFEQICAGRSGIWKGTHLRLGHAHVSLAEQELSVEVTDVDGIEVDHLDILEAAQHQGLEQLATDAARADHQDCGKGGEIRSAGTRGWGTDDELVDAWMVPHLWMTWRARHRSSQPPWRRSRGARKCAGGRISKIVFFWHMKKVFTISSSPASSPSCSCRT